MIVSNQFIKKSFIKYKKNYELTCIFQDKVTDLTVHIMEKTNVMISTILCNKWSSTVYLCNVIAYPFSCIITCLSKF